LFKNIFSDFYYYIVPVFQNPGLFFVQKPRKEVIHLNCSSAQGEQNITCE